MKTAIDFYNEADEPIGIGRVYWPTAPCKGDRVCLGKDMNFVVIDRQWSIHCAGDGSPLFNDVVAVLTLAPEP